MPSQSTEGSWTTSSTEDPRTAEAADLRTRLAISEEENSRLKAEISRLRAQLSDSLCHRGASQPNGSPPMSPLVGYRFSAGDPVAEAAAVRLQRSVRRWLAARPARRLRDAASNSGAEDRDRFKQALLDVEESVERAVEIAQCKEMWRVPQKTRLEMLANVLKQGAIQVTHVKNLQTLQELRRPVGISSLASGSG